MARYGAKLEEFGKIIRRKRRAATAAKQMVEVTKIMAEVIF